MLRAKDIQGGAGERKPPSRLERGTGAAAEYDFPSFPMTDGVLASVAPEPLGLVDIIESGKAHQTPMPSALKPSKKSQQ